MLESPRSRTTGVARDEPEFEPRPRTVPQRRPPADLVEAAIVEEATANQTDGYRMVTAFVSRWLGRPVNRKRVLRVMRERKLIQRRRPLERRKRPGFFRVERPRQLWQLDMTSIWVAEHGCYHHRPHSGLNYRTPHEVARTWEDQPELQKQAA